ncbi:hypothetical protein PUNSTDRAFT_71028 [Punctularia strigosozonata HHB-11173 SS5]|uniref:uncharacterized protein n=1 Tax=Punctularia strigosozonata (strain HHB-11173) TaxID=741275 RepID=UPI00044186AC|nr:uncharacterized protein PUNSTDRAFT_71028 [Punctularia strigosozonata HHB-11173 SS5]EIN07337.1 hypothetical protein PUNSTDRAFT_71028 [Punctularia strigosozonata HHB-11173 SS5]
MLPATVTRRCSNRALLSYSARRLLHATVLARNFVGPPDPVSNLRPVIYDDDLPSRSSQAVTHPYSLSEFKPDEAAEEREEMEYQYKAERQQLDNFNHRFWTDSNTRFEAGKAAVLSSLPADTLAADRERALSDFYAKWIQQEKHRQEEYSKQYRAKNISEIQLAARLHYQKLRMRIANVLS